MTDTDTDSGDGAFERVSSADELFGPIGTEPLADESTERRHDADRLETDEREETTAAELFTQLRDEGVDEDSDLLSGETPEEIIASADEPSEPPAQGTDDDLLADEGALEDLLLTDRREGEEFLWIDSGGPGEESREPAVANAEPTGTYETKAVDGDRYEPAMNECDDASDPADPRSKPVTDDLLESASDDESPTAEDGPAHDATDARPTLFGRLRALLRSLF